ncbi:hypothetical protein EBT25_07245, partial [bacterium]|nr:hypothetical protein [bacterium]
TTLLKCFTPKPDSWAGITMQMLLVTIFFFLGLRKGRGISDTKTPLQKRLSQCMIHLAGHVKPATTVASRNQIKFTGIVQMQKKRNA